MRQRETVVQWNMLEEGDKFLRYTRDDSVQRLVILRNAPDLPTEPGVMGYGTVEYRGFTEKDVLLIRRYASPSENEGYPWVAPLLSGTPGHILRDHHIVDFKEATLISDVMPGDLRDAIREAIGDVGTESLGGLVTAVEKQVWDLITSA